MPGISATQAGRLARSGTHLLNGSRTALVFDFDNDLYHHELGGSQVTRLTRTPEGEQEVSFSPDGRLVAFVREPQPPRRRRRRAAGARAHDRRDRRGAQRRARLGLPGGDLRPRQLPRLLVEPRLDAHRVPAARRLRGAGIHDRGPHRVPPRGREVVLSRRPAIRTPWCASGSRAPRAATPPGSTWTPTPEASRSSSASAGPRTAGASCSRSRTASRRGSISTSPIRKRGSRQRCCVRRRRPGSTSTARRSGSRTARSSG